MTDRWTEERSAPVSPRTKQAEEAPTPWVWAEPEVWTKRMLSALERGVKGGRWFSLIDKVYAPRTLEAAFEQVKAKRGAAGVDHQTIAMFDADRKRQLDRLAHELREGTYRPRGVRRVWIPKPGRAQERRPLGIPTVRDRVVQTALRLVLEPIFERDFAEHSYGFRPLRGCKDALRRVDALLKRGYSHVVDADLKGYFDSIPHEPLMGQVERKVSDGRVLGLLRSFLAQEVLEPCSRWTPEGGTPQGAVISPLLANIYLDPLDHLMAAEGLEMVRYADDFVILCRTAEEAERALALVEQWTVSAGLTLHPEKTRIVDMAGGGFDFLGYRFENGERWPRSQSLTKVKDAIRSKTKRNNGHSLERIIEDVNQTLRGWFEYFKHCKYFVFERLDRFVRTRLRAILRRRRGLRGIARGQDHVRWTNAYFTACGVFSLKAAYMTELTARKAVNH